MFKGQLGISKMSTVSRRRIAPRFISGMRNGRRFFSCVVLAILAYDLWFPFWAIFRTYICTVTFIAWKRVLGLSTYVRRIRPSKECLRPSESVSHLRCAYKTHYIAHVSRLVEWNVRHGHKSWTLTFLYGNTMTLHWIGNEKVTGKWMNVYMYILCMYFYSWSTHRG